MAGFENDIVYAKNADFTQADNQSPAEANGLATNGQLWIGTTALNAGNTHVNVGTITSPSGTLQIGYSSPNVTMDLVGGIVDLHTAKWIVNPVANSGGNSTTIQNAINNAVSGETIAIFPGTYTENLTLKAGVNLTAWGSDSSLNGTGKVIISGTCTLTTAGTVTISGMQLQTNSAPFLAVTGTLASVVNLNNCYLNCTNNTGITYSSSNVSSAVVIKRCSGNLGTTGIGLFTATGAGSFQMFYTDISNSGLSTTASTCSACLLVIEYCLLSLAVTTSSTASLTSSYSTYTPAAAGLNTTALTAGGSGSHGSGFDVFSSGSASAISVGASCTLIISHATVASTNTNAITGAGTIQYQGIAFTAASSTINTTTQSIAGTLQGSKVTVPTAGFLGEQIRAVLPTASVTALTTGTSKTVISISLTAGVWDVTGIVAFQVTGTTSVVQFQAGISPTNNTLLGNSGDDTVAFNYSGAAAVGFAPTLSVPSLRISLTSTTTYYLIANSTFSISTNGAYGRISATRVG